MGNPNYTVEAALSFRIDRKSVKEPTECGMAGGLSAPQKISHLREDFSVPSLTHSETWVGGEEGAARMGVIREHR